MSTPNGFRPIERYVRPGDLVYFLAYGNHADEPRLVRVHNPGPLGQTYVSLVDQRGADLPGGHLSVNPNRELFERV